MNRVHVAVVAINGRGSAHINISYRLGRELKYMGEYEKFVNDAGADTMLSTNHWPPYNLPEKI